MPKTDLSHFSSEFVQVTEAALAAPAHAPLRIELPTHGAALNLKMELNTFWKLVKRLPPEQAPGVSHLKLQVSSLMATLDARDDKVVVIMLRNESATARAMAAALNKRGDLTQALAARTPSAPPPSGDAGSGAIEEAYGMVTPPEPEHK